MEHFDELRMIAVAASAFHTLAISDRGDIYAWGAGTRGQCGALDASAVAVGKERLVLQPKPVRELSHRRMVQAAAGPYHSAAVSDDGAL